MVKNLSVTRIKPTGLQLHFEVDAKEFDEMSEVIYNKNKDKLPVFKGFRKGEAPRNIAERLMNRELKEQYYNTVADAIINKEYTAILESYRIKPLVQPYAKPSNMGSGKDLVIDMEFVVRPEIQLKRYKGIEILKTHTLATDEDVDKEVAAEAKKNASLFTIVDRPVQATDFVTMNYRGFIDGVLFEGGSSNDAKLEIGSKKYVPGFEDQLIGWNLGTKRNIEITFPEQYNPSVAGKKAIFEIEITNIQEQQIPTIDDEFAKDVGFDSLELLRADIKIRLQSALDQLDKDTNVQKILDILLEENGESIEVPVELFTEAVQRIANSANKDVSPEKINADIRKQFILDAIAEAEKIEAKPEDLQGYFQSIADRYHIPVETITAQLNKQLELQAKEFMTTKAVMDCLLDNCIDKIE